MGANAWQGDWVARLYERVKQRGFGSVSSFAASMPRATLFDLADTLGEDVAAIQIERVMYVEAEDAATIEAFARDMLVRQLRERLPEGWGNGSNFVSEAAGAWAAWKGMLDEAFAPAAVRMWHWLKGADIPTGWLPEGPDDPIIERAFAEVRFGIEDE